VAERSRTFALIPAAGLSRRMGRPKLTLPLAGKTILECVLETLGRAGVTDVLVVASPQGDEVAALAEKGGAHVLRLDHETLDMRATVLEGLDWLERRFQPAAEDGWLLLPADHPSLDSEAIRELLRCRAEYPRQSIFIPSFAGKRGHPALIAWRHVEALRHFPPGQGLNRFFREAGAQVREYPVNSPGVLLDLDTPEDYQRLLEGR
jgi:molybdenum cofactor cytidylyltransferase